jgi:hypothetical protein
MPKKGWKKETPEERAQWQKNHDRLRCVLERRLAQEGVTKEEALRRLRPDEKALRRDRLIDRARRDFAAVDDLDRVPIGVPHSCCVVLTAELGPDPGLPAGPSARAERLGVEGAYSLDCSAPRHTSSVPAASDSASQRKLAVPSMPNHALRPSGQSSTRPKPSGRKTAS